MINVCLVAPVPPPIGGIALWTSNIVNYHQEEVNFTIIDTSVSNSPAKKRTFIDRVFVSGIQMLKLHRKLKKIIKRKKVDCVHLATSGSLGFVRDEYLAKLCKKYHIKVILHLHFGRLPSIINQNNKEAKMFRKIANIVDGIVCMDSNTYLCLKSKKEINEKIRYIPNPISYKNSYINQSEKEKSIVYVGWVVRTKGVEELLEAWDKISKNYNDWKLKIVGAYNENYKQLLLDKNECNNVNFVGEINHDECIKEIEKASILILPSYTEGFPNVILEAMMASTAIIATNVGDIPHMLSNDCGVIINHHSTSDIVEAIDTLINKKEKREIISLNAYKKVNDEYTIEKVFNMLLKEWRD